MECITQKITDDYAIYNGDCVEIIKDIPKESIGLTIYSPPFCGLYNYSSSNRDMSNCHTYESFLKHYSYLLPEIDRITIPGRLCVVHCADIPNPGQRTGYYDLQGKLIDLHTQYGFYFYGRICIWKEPLRVTIRTRLKHLTHKQLTKDSASSTIAAGDFILLFKKKGDNPKPITHKNGFQEYHGERKIPDVLQRYKGITEQKENKLSHWIWRKYASCIWDDIRIERVLPFKESKEPDDEKHVHALQLDVIERCIALWSNPGDTVFTPFMGVGSEVYTAVKNDRKGIGIELKPSYYKQSVKNLASLTRSLKRGKTKQGIVH